jgi:putative hydrolase of HD superfamily
MDHDIFGLFKPLKKIKFIKRHGWVQRDLEADTIAAHNFDSLHLGWYLAKKEGLDPARIKSLLEVHDLVMVYMEDVTPKSGKYQDKEGLEKEAMKQLAADLPQEMREEYLALLREFQEQKTPGARIAKEADKLATLLQGDAYEEETGRSDIQDEFLGTYASVFENATKTSQEIFAIIQQRHKGRKL